MGNTILIIEDNPVNTKLLTVYLEAEGFQVLHAPDGTSGIQTATEKEGIDAVLLDRIMPDMDGLEVLKSLKHSDFAWHIPVIMLTAAMSPQQVEEAKLYGAYGYLPKPYDKLKIVNMVRQAIKDSS
jgi:CheY-like chemotaxis protein